MLGYVNIDNKGVAGIERYVDEVVGVESVQGATLAERPPVRLSLDIGVQHAVEAELADAVDRYEAKGAAGVVLDVTTGEVLASASLPAVDPAKPNLDKDRNDKIAGSTFELGSVFKTLTVAMAIDQALVTPGDDHRRAQGARRRTLHHQGSASAAPTALRGGDLPAFL